MMTSAETLRAVRDLAVQAIEVKDHDDCRLLLIQIHTLAKLGAHYAGRDEARAAFAALPVPEHQVTQ